MNELLINDEIGYWGITASWVKEKLSQMQGAVTVKISSIGGNVFEGIEIHNALKEYDRGEVIVDIVSVAASISSYIAMAGDKIRVFDNATFMIHNAWLPTVGDHNELRKTADIAEGLSSIMAKRYSEISGQPIDVIQQKMDDETYFFGEEIKTNGFCDEIITSQKDTSKQEAVALAREGFTACCKKMAENFNKDEFVQSAAKLTKDGILALKQEKDEVLETQVADDAEHKNRLRELEIMNKGMKL